MSNVIEGFVGNVSERTGNGKRGPWAVDNLLIQDAQGNDIGWYGLGFRDDPQVPPPVKKGDFVEFQWEQDGQYKKIVKGTAKIKKDAPKQTAPAPDAGASPGTNRQDSIVYQSSRKDAIQLVEVLLDNDALPLSAKNTKAGKAARYDEVVAAVNQLTVNFFRDVETLRLFDTVADTGDTDTSAQGELPEDAEPDVSDDEVYEEDFDDDIRL